jgi:glucuronoarabinoxylan endo-1,4-beta-xylanase
MRRSGRVATIAVSGLAVVLAAGLSASAASQTTADAARPTSPARPATLAAARAVPRAAGTGTGAAAVTIDPGQRYQVINGFGFAEAFREPVISSLPAAELQQVGSLLFSPVNGAGMSIVRFGLGGATDPGDPIQGPGDVADQVWLGKLAEQFGVHQFYADAWSAPPEMKTNGSLDNGGSLCGVPGESCLNGDYRQAYADVLAALAKGFADQGIPLEDVDFVNEPEIGPAYASMQMTPAQAAGFVPYLGRALAGLHLRTKVACCDAEGWTDGEAYTQAVLGDPAAARYIGLITSHGYTAPPTVPLTSARPVWESEWANFDPWDPAWDDGTQGSGFTWAQDIQTALVSANVNAFFYWWGASASTANSGLIQVVGPTINLSKRYWAFAAFGRYIRPGATRIGAASPDSSLQVSAFRNRDGSVVAEILNTGTTDQPVSLQGIDASGASAYVTDEADSLAPETAGSGLVAPARSLTTVVIPAASA